MDVAGRNTHHDRGHAQTVDVDRPAVGRAAGHVGKLERDVKLGRRVDDQVAQLQVCLLYTSRCV